MSIVIRNPTTIKIQLFQFISELPNEEYGRMGLMFLNGLVGSKIRFNQR
jgi:hypothetical protein